MSRVERRGMRVKIEGRVNRSKHRQWSILFLITLFSLSSAVQNDSRSSRSNFAIPISDFA